MAPQVIRRGFELRQSQVLDITMGTVSRRWTAFIETPGGLALIQDPVEAAAAEMPGAAFAEDDPQVLPIDALAHRVARFCGGLHALA